MSHTVNVTDATFDTEVLQSSGLTIVDFWTTWCGPCKMIAPVLEQIAAERPGIVKVAKFNMDEITSTASRLNVRSVPTLMFFKEGAVVAQIVGAVPRARIEATVDQYAAINMGQPGERAAHTNQQAK